MEKDVLIKVDIINISIDAMMQEFSTLRMYLSDFKRAKDGKFISEAKVNQEGKLITNSINLRNALLDQSFNEAGQYSGKDDENGNPIYEDGDANIFFKRHSEGFKFAYYLLCEL